MVRIGELHAPACRDGRAAARLHKALQIAIGGSGLGMKLAVPDAERAGFRKHTFANGIGVQQPTEAIQHENAAAKLIDGAQQSGMLPVWFRLP